MGVGVSVFVMNKFPILGIMSANKGKWLCLRLRKAKGPNLAVLLHRMLRNNPGWDGSQELCPPSLSGPTLSSSPWCPCAAALGSVEGSRVKDVSPGICCVLGEFRDSSGIGAGDVPDLPAPRLNPDPELFLSTALLLGSMIFHKECKQGGLF